MRHEAAGRTAGGRSLLRLKTDGLAHLPLALTLCVPLLLLGFGCLHPLPLMQHREAFLIQLFFAAQLRNEDIIALLEDQCTGHVARLETLEHIAIPPTEDPQQQRRQALVRLALDFGLRMERMYIAWLTDALLVVRSLPEDADR